MNGTLNAAEAKDCNIVSHVLNEGNAEQRVLIECDKLATKSPVVSLTLFSHCQRFGYRCKCSCLHFSFNSQVLETFRLIQQHNLLPKLKEAMKIEQKQLLLQWTKSDFVEKLKTQL